MLNEMVSYFKEFAHNWPLVTLSSSLFTFFLGLYVGHRTALIRDKRKEFNEAAEPCLAYFEQVMYESQHALSYSTAMLPIDGLEKVKRRLSAKNAKRLNALTVEIISFRNSEDPTKHNRLSKLAKKASRILRLR